MTELLTADQMRALETEAMARGAVTGLELMERAGRGVVAAILKEWPAFATGSHAACVLAGSGNNGGDGFVIARLLHEAGWQVRVHFAGDRPGRSSDARIMHGKWSALGEVLPLTAQAVFSGPRPDLIVDAVFGIGLTRPLPETIAEVLDGAASRDWTRWHEIRRVAVDCPSGLDLDRGRMPSEADPEGLPQRVNMADLTVTFHSPKPGHYLGVGPKLCGKLAVVDIGLGAQGAGRAMLGQPPDKERIRLVAPLFANRPIRPKVWPLSFIAKNWGEGHKYDHGHVAVLSGGVGRGGAARMAARAALRSGAGLVTVLCPPAALIENASQLTAVMLRALARDKPLSEVADDRVSGFVLGPGMGVSEATRQRVIEVLARRAEGSARRDPVVVLDADALTSFEGDSAALFGHAHPRTVLTPHGGEFARLFPDLAEAMRGRLSKVDAVRQAAARAGCVVLLKGPDTVIAEPGGAAAVHATAYGREVPWLATAGAGDVLAGLIAGLAAPQASGDTFAMVEIAVWLHAEAARRFGPGLIAEDIPDALPGLLRDLEEGRWPPAAPSENSMQRS